MPDYSMDFSKIRENRKQNKSRASLGNEEELISTTHSKSNTVHSSQSDDLQFHQNHPSTLRDQLRDHQAEMLEQLLESGEIQSGKGLNQERGLQRPSDTHWGSHFKTLDNFAILFSSITHVLDAIKCGGSKLSDRLQAGAFLDMINEFEFVFLLHLMLKILVMPNELSAALQRKEQDIVNAWYFLTSLNKDCNS
ncbi:uncharacterized protein LOC129902033 isoform X1 [Solanum dulcamara]|uniref:uncharacterized protein LOC129902033 isoform X1 n=1 Tax=Solanum dulcamara TaxID=45834 RepID=UPI0024859270|nr:uncharacterized protein LOC129902033 isoform X1 [Solanum dulcamara]